MGKNWTSGQRFHKGRVGSMVTPGVSGFLFTIDPTNVGKSIRETEQLLEAYCADMQSVVPSGPTSIPAQPAEQACAAPISSISALLMEELNSVSTGPTDSKVPKSKRPKKPIRFLETNCKGYTFFSIPRPAAARGGGEGPSGYSDDDASVASGESPPCVESDDQVVPKRMRGEVPAPAEPTTAAAAASPISINTNVSAAIERIVPDLVAAPRPVARYTHRMIPVHVTCFPTQKFVVDAARALCGTLQMPPGHSAIRLGIQLLVRNNSKVDKETATLRSAIQAALPMNRFLVLQPRGGTKVELDAMLHVCVMHSTACIGVSVDFTKRHGYNLHDISKVALQAGLLSSEVSKPEPASAKQLPEVSNIEPVPQ